MTEKTYTPPPITGYRTLTQAEVDLINEIKALGAQALALSLKVRAHVGAQTAFPGNGDEAARLHEAEPGRWAAIGKTHFQEGLMALTRAVAQPRGF